MRMKVLITRAEPAADQTANNLAKHGHEAILLPLFKMIDTQARIPDKKYDGIIFTSKNAVEVLKTRGWKIPNPKMIAFCVGGKTEKAAQALGFKQTYSANGGGAVLVDLMRAMQLEGKKLLYLSTPDKSYDMKMALESHNVHVETIDIYQAKPVQACTLISISDQAIGPLEDIDWKAVLIAPSPQEKEMIALVR